LPKSRLCLKTLPSSQGIHTLLQKKKKKKRKNKGRSNDMASAETCPKERKRVVGQGNSE